MMQQRAFIPRHHASLAGAPLPQTCSGWRCCPRSTLKLPLQQRVSALGDLDELNPQNVPNPKVVPSRSFSPLEAVSAQLEAISRNDEPWANHGVQTMYEFAADAGSMERSRYFGFSKDLYHFDHFLHFKTACAALVDCQSYSILPGPPEAVQQQQQLPAEASPVVYYVSVADAKGADGGVFEFRMVQGEFGLKQGCWMTKSCRKVS